ncbi:hypothetical protein B0H34DRAFT_689146 [Crassisporium funariophilum]|nr:hypothetical protein B0H34DRAFT_689146 [Crassisporium funariophilum]
MARKRKGNAPDAFTVTSPSKMPLRPAPDKPLVEISEDEQWRLIDQSGILNEASLLQTEQTATVNVEEITLFDEVFNAVLLIIPFSSLLLLMEILIRHQYGRRASLEDILDRMLPGVPILSLFIFYTTRYKYNRRMQVLLFAISTLVGCRMIYQLDSASWLVNMSQCPPMATVWVYTIVQLDLGPAVVSLATVGMFVWWKGLQIFK